MRRTILWADYALPSGQLGSRYDSTYECPPFSVSNLPWKEEVTAIQFNQCATSFFSGWPLLRLTLFSEEWSHGLYKPLITQQMWKCDIWKLRAKRTIHIHLGRGKGRAASWSDRAFLSFSLVTNLRVFTLQPACGLKKKSCRLELAKVPCWEHHGISLCTNHMHEKHPNFPLLTPAAVVPSSTEAKDLVLLLVLGWC